MDAPNRALFDRIADTLDELLTAAPQTTESAADDPQKRAAVLAGKAARRAAALSGVLAVPPGPMAWLAVLPDLLLIWRIQAQLVADIAGAFGRQAHLGREQMIFCLFRYSAAQAVRGLVVRNGERWLVQRLSQQALRAMLATIGMRIGKATVAKLVPRAVPVIGAAGVAAYAYYDTQRVARTAVALFERKLEMASATPEPAAAPA